MNLSEIRQVLSEKEIQLTRSLGQNFMHDRNQICRIVESGEVSKADKVLEIGPGLGPLTELLVEKAGTVLAIETDQRLVDILRDKFKSVDNFEIIKGDALAILRNERREWAD